MHAASPVPAPAIPVIRDAIYPRDRFMRLPEVISTCGLSRSTIYDLISREQFPSQISSAVKTSPGWRQRLTAGCRPASHSALEVRSDFAEFWHENLSANPRRSRFFAETPTSVVSGSPVTAPAFTSGMHGHISVMGKKAKPARQQVKKENGNSDQIRRNPITS